MIERRPLPRPQVPSLWSSPALRPFVPRFLWVAAYFAALHGVGTAGYVFIEGWDWHSAFFMAAITATAVGYGEVHPLTESGRMFTIALMGASIVGLGLWWALTTALVVELDLGGIVRRRRTMQKIEHIKDHFIVCGAGRMGRVIIQEMRRAEVPFVVLERDPHNIDLVREIDASILILEGDATKEQKLIEVGIEQAKGLAACLADDADNLLLTLTARGLRPDLEIVARAYDEETLDKLRRAGANHAVSPNITGAVRIASTLMQPSIISFLDAITVGTDVALRLEDAIVPESSALVGKTLADARIPQKTGLMVLALRPAGKRQAVYNPSGDTRLNAGDVMIVLGNREQVQNLRAYAGGGALEV